MGKINVTILDVTGNKEKEATVPDDVPVKKLCSKLVEMLNLPTTSQNGEMISYKLNHKATGKQLQDDQTLADASVKDGDIMRLQPEITAGKGF